VSAETYSFDVGDIRCTAVADGTHSYAPPVFPPPGVFLFFNASPSERDSLLQQRGLGQWAAWTSPYTCLLVRTGKRMVLVDTGAGSLGPNTGKLLQNLRSVSVAPDDIDTIVITHAHPDHIGGNTSTDGKTVFRNARFIIWKAEWDFWMSGQAERVLDERLRAALVGPALKNLTPIKDRVDLVTEECQFAPGIGALAAPGHTPGHMAVTVSSGNDCLLCLSDVVLHSIHLERPEWCAAVDMIPDKTAASRRRLLNMPATGQTLVMAFHFPFPGLGRVITNGETWRLQPVEALG